MLEGEKSMGAEAATIAEGRLFYYRRGPPLKNGGPLVK